MSKEWCLDSGASLHMCCNRNMFETFKAYEEQVNLADSKVIKAIGKGDVRLNLKEGEILLKNVLCVPELRLNFISIS